MKGILKVNMQYFILFFILICLTSLSACGGVTPSADPPTINSFTASSTSITEGESVTLSWAVTDATNVSINHGIGSVVIPSGSTIVIPTATTTYTLTAANSAGSIISTITINVNETLTILVNGDFNTCDFTGWTVTTAGEFPKIFYTDDCAVHMGDGAAELYDSITNTASIQQTVCIHSDAVNPELSFYYLVSGTDDDGEGWDWMKVFVNDNEILYVWSDSVGWKRFQYNLSSYTGTCIILKITSWTGDTKCIVNYYIDGININWE